MPSCKICHQTNLRSPYGSCKANWRKHIRRQIDRDLGHNHSSIYYCPSQRVNFQLLHLIRPGILLAEVSESSCQSMWSRRKKFAHICRPLVLSIVWNYCILRLKLSRRVGAWELLSFTMRPKGTSFCKGQYCAPQYHSLDRSMSMGLRILDCWNLDPSSP